LGDIDIREGIFSIQTTTAQVGNPANSINVFNNATLAVFGLNTTPLNKQIVLRDGATIFNENGSSVISGPITLQGSNTINAATAGTNPQLALSGRISGTGSLRKIGSGPLVLAGTNNYAGATIVSNGTLFVDGTIDASTVTVYGGTLGGTGALTAPVVIAPGGTLSPGHDAMGIVTIDNVLTLSGTALMDLNKSSSGVTSDLIAGFSALTYGGTLRLNLSGDPLVAGDVFTLFSFASATGEFTSIIPAAPGPNLAWDRSQLAVDGTLKVIVAAAGQPRFGSVSLLGTNLLIRGTGGTSGSSYYVLSSTNLVLPRTNWARVATNLFDASGNFNFTNAVDRNAPQRFFIIQVP